MKAVYTVFGFNKKEVIGIFGLVALVLGFVLYLSHSMYISSVTVTNSYEAGRVITANYINSSFDADRTRIETEGGVYLVHGSVSVQKGKSFMYEERKNGQKLLCVKNTKDCHPLVD